MSEYIDKAALTNKLKSSGAIGDFALYILGNFPTADVAPVVHGKWIKTGLRVMISSGEEESVCACSACKELPPIGYTPPYCQNCGAKMDGGARNDG